MVSIPPLGLPGILAVPDGAAGIVVFAHGSGSSHLSPRNAAVAATIREAGLASLLFDLLTPQEAQDRANVFNIPLLADRLDSAIRFVRAGRRTTGLRVGLFGASTGAAAALVSAGRDAGRMSGAAAGCEQGPTLETASAGGSSEPVSAVVSRGGRPDLAGDMLRAVRAPTLLIVGGDDGHVLALNRAARREMICETELTVIPGASHLFEEPGAMEEVARLASQWFTRHAGRPRHA